MLKAIIFDLDNTLVDFLFMKNQAIDAAIIGMKESGLDLSHDEAKKIFLIFMKKKDMNTSKCLISLLYLFMEI